MADLTMKPPAGIDPVSIGTVTLSEAPLTPICAIMPYHGKTQAVSKAMTKAHGAAFPGPNQMTRDGDTIAAFSGLDQAFLMGVAPDAALAAHAALIDQSDAWAHLVLEGDRVEDVLARLVPLDLSRDAFPVNATRRSSLGHMATLFLRPAEARFDIFVFRSMAHTAVHEIKRAMRGVAARHEP